MEPSHVLVPLDGSPLADDALEYALAVHDCRLTVLNVVTPIDAGMSEGGVLETGDDRLDEAEERAERLVENAKKRAEERGREVETVVRTGSPAETILEYVEEEGIDAVVMGSHGDNGDTVRRILGTVSTEVVADSPVPVTVVK